MKRPYEEPIPVYIRMTSGRVHVINRLSMEHLAMNIEDVRRGGGMMLDLCRDGQAVNIMHIESISEHPIGAFEDDQQVTHDRDGVGPS